MGTCYSKAGHEVDSTPAEKRPRTREKHRSASLRNGHPAKKFKNPRLVVEDYNSVQKDVSDTVYTEDSHTMHALDVDNLMNKSQQTSLDMLVKDANKNIETFTAYDGCGRDEDGCDKDGDTANIGDDITTRDVILGRLQADDTKVVTSDSGIVVEQCDDTIKHTVEDSLSDDYSANFESNLNNVETVVDRTVPVETKLELDDTDRVKPDLHLDLQTVHSCSCSYSNFNDSRGSVFRAEHSSGCHGESPSHLFYERSNSELSEISKSSETLLLKSSLRKGKTKSRKKKGLSWKSADSLDWFDSMSTCLDRTKSVCSSILGDDISLLNAPLATFDSIDFSLGSNSDLVSQTPGDNAGNHVEYRSDTFEFKFDFSGIEGENRRSVASVSDTRKSTDSTTDLDKIKLAIRQSSVTTPTEQRSVLDALDEGSGSPALQPEVMTMTMNGREVVVIHSELFSQILDEIQFLKLQLSQLTKVIQESEDQGSGVE